MGNITDHPHDKIIASLEAAGVAHLGIGVRVPLVESRS